jgi:hypothetical protein
VVSDLHDLAVLGLVDLTGGGLEDRDLLLLDGGDEELTEDFLEIRLPEVLVLRRGLSQRRSGG